MKRLIAIAVLLIVGACGFDPGTSNTQDLITAVEVQPNPFSPPRERLNISYVLRKSAVVTIEVVPEENLPIFPLFPVQTVTIERKSIRTLVDERLSPGRYAIHWDGRDDKKRAVKEGYYKIYIIAETDDERQVKSVSVEVR